MAKIPRIMPTGNTITSDSPSAFQRTTGFSGKALQTIGGEISNYGEMFKQANALAEKTKAQNDLESKLNDIHSRADADTDISETRRQQYDREINQATEDSAKFITLPQEKALYSMEAKSRADITRNRINNSFIKKTIADGKEHLDIYLNNKKNDFIKAQSFSEKQMAMVERDQKVVDMVKAGILDPADATHLLEFQRKDWAKSQVEYDIATNPVMARDILKDKQYPDITEEQRVDLLDKANSAIRKNNQDALDMAEFNRINTEAEYLGKLSAGELNWMTAGDIANDVRAGRVSERFGLAMTDVIKSRGRYKPQATENQNYPEFINNIYKAKDQKELNDSLLNLLKEHKNMSQEKLAVLINGAMQRSKSLPLHAEEGGQVDPKQQEIDSGAMAVTNFGRRSGMSSNEIGNIYQNYNKDIAAGKTPKEAFDAATRAHVVAQYPAAATMDNPPNLIIDANSPIRVIFPRTSGQKDATTKPSKDVSK